MNLDQMHTLTTLVAHDLGTLKPTEKTTTLPKSGKKYAIGFYALLTLIAVLYGGIGFLKIRNSREIARLNANISKIQTSIDETDNTLAELDTRRKGAEKVYRWISRSIMLQPLAVVLSEPLIDRTRVSDFRIAVSDMETNQIEFRLAFAADPKLTTKVISDISDNVSRIGWHFIPRTQSINENFTNLEAFLARKDNQ